MTSAQTALAQTSYSPCECSRRRAANAHGGELRMALLFAVVVDFVLRSVDSTGLRLKDRLLSDLDFADDIAIFETCKSPLQPLLTTVQQKSEGFGLNINANKTKGMATSDSPMNIKCNDNDVEKMLYFKYPGSAIANTGSTAIEVVN
ncbi:uncharacterized protein LOC136030659 [Artemia franciscana]|uniref:uncharacterized protein LOC136030659 n=1 Tax=Artemia franciscana TaxID=6661 RepID=UPI0032DAB5F9